MFRCAKLDNNCYSFFVPSVVLNCLLACGGGYCEGEKALAHFFYPRYPSPKSSPSRRGLTIAPRAQNRFLSVELGCGFEVEGFCEHADRVLHCKSGGHLYLPFAGFAVAGHKVRGNPSDLVEEWLSDGL